MRLSKAVFLWGLVAALTITPSYAKESTLPVAVADLALDEAYLQYWFSVDSAESINLTLTPMDDDALGARAEIRFTSDDGQPVNGMIAWPRGGTASTRLALALHPMGSDLQFWWNHESSLATHTLATRLREQGYTVISLDARRHGQRGQEGFGPRELLTRAHSDEPRLYIETIIGSVRDYRAVLRWAKDELGSQQVLAMGYSMGAQMSLLLASFEPDISAVLVMVPPFVGSDSSPVAPRIHVDRISDAEVLWLAGSKDPYSNQEQTRQTFEQITSSNKTLTWFDAGHRLPDEFLQSALDFLASLPAEGEQ